MTDVRHRSRPKRRLFLESRYRKLVRGLPQTVFYCPECKGDRRRRQDCARCEGRGKLYDDSVQELLGRRLLPAFRARFGKFHGAGREDVDVRMLGRGRPFVYELVQPRREDVDLDAVLAELNEREGERVVFQPFRVVPRKRVAELKEAVYAKVYRAEVEFEADVPEQVLGDLSGSEHVIRQRTPLRVAHRRGDLHRERTVAVLEVEVASPRTCAIEMRCEHGTYVKEWISGDEQRTRPSLAELVGVGAACKTLDVVEILDE